ncbi:M24 family metallopeptidase [Nocardiopsis ansamitocini]|uniref:Xaa-Pro aminopeptidase n=1 Tax=Nocardiopsis ansamitocini TaxID=1670832 RepID=A0A9W6P8G8_9ACTN|nr:Xaa-Pro peptidase family protein [Nocardiopsis ansamitocini]GLU49095.1 Xaa-Pro aminopeptidase [Nocardiopsis ansamitocini]
MELAFTLSTYDERLTRTRARMGAQSLDGIVLTMPDTIHWLTGVSSVGYLWPQALVVGAGAGEPTLVTRTTEEPCVRRLSWLRSVRYYDIAAEEPIAVIAEAIRAAGLGSATVGLDLDTFTLSPGGWDRLRTLLPEVTWVDTSMLVPEERLVKSADELAYQHQAARIADHAMNEVFAALRPGISEVELAGIAAAALGAAGGEHAAIPPMVVTGERSALVHAMAGRRTVAHGDVVCVELAGVVNRYHAVLMRSAVIGEPSPRVREVADCLERATEAAIAAAVPGAPAHAPDTACDDVLSELGLVANRCHRIGYSVGVAYPPGWLEPMTLVAGDDHVITPGMSFTIEPNLALLDEGFGLKMGDTVLCTPEGPRSLSALDHALRVIA